MSQPKAATQNDRATDPTTVRQAAANSIAPVCLRCRLRGWHGQVGATVFSIVENMVFQRDKGARGRPFFGHEFFETESDNFILACAAQALASGKREIYR
ncbi:hypothetical protein ACFQZE_14590 [Paenibacillus sp. GCM10027627]